MMFVACDDFELQEDCIEFTFGKYTFSCNYHMVNVVVNGIVEKVFWYSEIYSASFKIPTITLEIGFWGEEQLGYSKEE